MCGSQCHPTISTVSADIRARGQMRTLRLGMEWRLSRMLDVSGSEKGAVPQYVSLLGSVLEPAVHQVSSG